MISILGVPIISSDFLLVLRHWTVKGSEKKNDNSHVLNKQNTFFDLSFVQEKDKSKQDFLLSYCGLDRVGNWFQSFISDALPHKMK